MGGYIETIYRMKGLGNGKGNYFTIEGDMEEIPDNTNYLEIREVYLEKLTKLPSKLKVLLLYETDVMKWPAEFPKGLVELVINGGNFSSIPKIPTLKSFRCKYANFKKASLSGLSKKLEILDIRDARIKSVAELSKKLTLLDLSGNDISRFPNFSYLKKLEILDLRNNPITSFSKGLPPPTTQIYCNLPEGVSYPDYLKKSKIKSFLD
jgi:Leucine-rich repeat (LRR) protein